MKFQLKKNACILAGALLCVSASSHATNDGSLGATSVGDLDISLAVPDIVKISSVGDIDLGTFAGADIAVEEGVCIYRNGTGAYTIEFEAGINRGLVDAPRDTVEFSLESASGPDTIPYTVDFEDSATGAFADTNLAINTPLIGQTGEDTDPACGGDINARVRVNVAAADAGVAAPGSYVGTLYMIVAPE